jgi:hypothetical protein
MVAVQGPNEALPYYIHTTENVGSGRGLFHGSYQRLPKIADISHKNFTPGLLG